MKYILTEKELEIPEGITLTVKSREVTVKGTLIQLYRSPRNFEESLQTCPLRCQKNR
jgi:ribosomal protein L6P/L9E